MAKSKDELVAVTWFSWAAIAFLAAVLALVTWLSWPGPPPPEQPRAREYRDYDICLLTDAKGIQGPAAQVWQQLDPVSVQTKSRRTFLPVPGEQTEAAAVQMVATQVQQQCDIIVAVGEVPVAGATVAAPTYPQIQFVLVGGKASGANVSNVEVSAVEQAVRAKVR